MTPEKQPRAQQGTTIEYWTVNARVAQHCDITHYKVVYYAKATHFEVAGERGANWNDEWAIYREHEDGDWKLAGRVPGDIQAWFGLISRKTLEQRIFFNRREACSALHEACLQQANRLAEELRQWTEQLRKAEALLL